MIDMDEHVLTVCPMTLFCIPFLTLCPTLEIFCSAERTSLTVQPIHLTIFFSQLRTWLLFPIDEGKRTVLNGEYFNETQGTEWIHAPIYRCKPFLA